MIMSVASSSRMPPIAASRCVARRHAAEAHPGSASLSTRHRRGRVIGRFLWRIVSLHKRSKVFAGCCIRLKMFQISARPTD